MEKNSKTKQAKKQKEEKEVKKTVKKKPAAKKAPVKKTAKPAAKTSKKADTKKETKKETEKAAPVKKERYFEAVGRRKTAVARVRLYTKKAGVEINGRELVKYFPLLRLQKKTVAPLEKMKINDKLGATVKVKGGGFNAQAEAISLGISRALVKFNADFRKRLRRFNYLTRDSRKVERKKYGLKKARRAPQWKKR